MAEETNPEIVKQMIQDLRVQYLTTPDFAMKFELSNLLQKWLTLAQRYEKGSVFTQQDLMGLIRAIQSLPQDVQDQVFDAIAAELGDKFSPALMDETWHE